MGTDGQIWRQYIIGAIANIGIVMTGYSMGWTSPVSIKLKDANLTDSPLAEPITVDQESWIGSILNLGAILGPFIAGPLAAYFGRKWTLILSSTPLFIGYILIVAATAVEFLYAGRFMWGVGAGMLFTVSPMYCAEIATISSRGALGSFLQVFITLGFLVVYVIGPYISYSAIAYVAIVILAVFDILVFFMPETPIYHLTKNDRDSAAVCLSIIRGQSCEGVESELDVMAKDVAASMAKTATIRDVFRGSNFKAFYISCALMFFQQFCGINAVLFYMANIFEASGAKLDSSIATIIVGVVQAAGSWMTPFVVDRLGRRLLLMISTCGSAITSALLGLYFLLDHLDSPIAASIRFLPLLSLVIFMVTYGAGLGPLPWAVTSELFPIEVKAVAAPVTTAFCWLLSFLVTKYFGPVSQALGMYAAFFFFGVCCVLAFFFTIFFVPETKGKSLAEIRVMLS
ncbi:facilitated trehalose transporter Tret1-like [Leguminivora glycinivorella]|uniref:facilitated trehalose transporter Tret1-like n=1 Tax=Leguminivora glycinivorella TaxID=1035111 RepID=UPI00200CDBAA|nr:facilitated trehalose transporter Tret1-like [Leguminivora glycinivorella]